MRGEVKELTGQEAGRVTFVATKTSKNYDMSKFSTTYSLPVSQEG